MRLTVLGSCASYAGAGRACAGHLLEAGDARVMFDIGNGTLANLARVVDPLSLDAVFISHEHPDHFADLYALQAMLRYAPEGPAPSMRVHCPDGLLDRVACILSERGRSEFAQAFHANSLEGGREVSVAPITVTPFPVEHVGPTFALVAQSGGRRLCYTSDTRYGEDVRRAAQGAHVVLADSTLPFAYAGQAPHMTPSEAGLLAAEAGASTLVLTHMWPTTPRDAILDDARAHFQGEVLLADELLTIDI